MTYESALRSIQIDGFRWHRFRDYFPFGDESLREGNYQRLVEASLESLTMKDAQQLLLDLLDAQACVYAEQVWVANEMAEKVGAGKPFPVGGHFPMTWLQINDNLRVDLGLEMRGARQAMLGLRPPETLAARIIRDPAKHGR